MARTGRGQGEIAVVDPDGTAGKMLASLGYTTRAWNGAAAPLVVVGRNALKEDPAMAARLETYVRGGGRAMILRKTRNGWHGPSAGGCARRSARRVFPMDSPVARGIDADDLRDWTGSSTLIEAYPKTGYVKGEISGPATPATRASETKAISPTPAGTGATAARSPAPPSRSPTAAAGGPCWNASSTWPIRR